MAHPQRIKGRAIGMLATGHSCRHVAEVTGIPLSTIGRWRIETFEYLRKCLRTTARGRALLDLAQRYRFAKNGTKKEAG